MTCPDCKGVGLSEILVHGRLRSHSCLRCGGACAVPDAMAGWMERGAVMRRQRIESGLTMRAEAERLGVDMLLLSNAENGRIDPALIG